MGPILQISKLSFRDVKYLTKICAASEGSWEFPAELSEGGWIQHAYSLQLHGE